MENYLGEFPVEVKDTPFAKFTRDDWALYFIGQYGGMNNGSSRKQWLIDQVARILNGASIKIVQARWGGGYSEYRISVCDDCAKYTKWVQEMKAGEEGPETYDWDEGVHP